MCGRYTLSPDADAIRSEFGVSVPDGYRRRFNVAPSQDVLTIIRDTAGGEDRAGWLRWGLVPHWARDPAIGNRMINARAEGLAAKPAFRGRRCLIVADGFYEWAKVTGERRKQPYWIHRSDGRLLALAGLWERWSGDDGEIVSCTIVTTEPTDVVRPIHDRMPLLLSREDRERWLDPDSDPELLTDITRRPDGAALEARAVSTAVNAPTVDGPECVEPLR